ncbi:dienelactone hydrolase family protein [Cupriavidus taiwanensis]|uniref:dienelactone hydrolase family protein n=1 Tax=Cupriavidus taiwanensis TaxID=164546 RepID=UPI003F68A838
MRTSWTRIPASGGRAYDGYLALPPAGTGPGLVLFQEIFGVNRHIRTVAEQYAQLGFVVLAPDVFWRQAPRESFGYAGDEAARARDILLRADIAEIVADLEGTVQALRQRPEVSGGVGALGFCIGGRLAYLAAAAGLVDAAACYYGGGIQDQLQKAAAVRCPMLFHYGETDPMIPLAAVERVKAAFAGQDTAKFFVYAGASHGFNCWERASYQPLAAMQAHGRTVLHFARHLTTGPAA